MSWVLADCHDCGATANERCVSYRTGRLLNYPHRNRTFAPTVKELMERMHDEECGIYFVESIGQSIVKIGKTRQYRFRNLNATYPMLELKLLAFETTHFSVLVEAERALHRCFHNERIGVSEWFKMSPRLDCYIEQVAGV